MNRPFVEQGAWSASLANLTTRRNGSDEGSDVAEFASSDGIGAAERAPESPTAPKTYISLDDRDPPMVLLDVATGGMPQCAELVPRCRPA